MREHYDYDVVIIGAGISGLVCGCYLAKAGLKTLIVEKNAKPGGYCTSFARNGYIFDAAIHYIGGIRTGSLSKILRELEILDDLKFNQFDPTDKIVLPDNFVYVRANPQDTINEFKKSFPKEKGAIEKFFHLIMQGSLPEICRKVMGLSLRGILDEFFKGGDLKAGIEILFWGNMGLPASQIAAMTAVVFFREFLLDPGYYPAGGIQNFPNKLAERFSSYGGELLLNHPVEEVSVDNNAVQWIAVSDGRRVTPRFLVSGIDATQLFDSLIRRETREKEVLKKLVPSVSVFALYLGISKNLPLMKNESCDIWIVSTPDIEECYKSLDSSISRHKIPLAMVTIPSYKEGTFAEGAHKTVIEVLTLAPFMTEEFWTRERELVADNLLGMAACVLPGLTEHLAIRITATPHTFHRYTLNRNGAAYGWAATQSQTNSALFPQKTSIDNLFLVGHWAIMSAGQGGVSTVALSGKKAADQIIPIAQRR